jgi:hypothetical protein
VPKTSNAMMKRFLAFLFVTMMSVALYAQPPKPGTDAFLPTDQLPPTEQMPSAPYVIAAYGVVWLIAMFYLWTIWRRIGKVEADMKW